MSMCKAGRRQVELWWPKAGVRTVWVKGCSRVGVDQHRLMEPKCDEEGTPLGRQPLMLSEGTAMQGEAHGRMRDLRAGRVG